MADVYDAGAVRSTADLDRDPFINGLKMCLAEGRKFAAERFTATVDVNVKGSLAEIEALRLALRRLGDEQTRVAKSDTDAAKAATAQARADAARARADAEQARAAAVKAKGTADAAAAQARADAARARADLAGATAAAKADAARYHADTAHLRAQQQQIRNDIARDQAAAAAARRATANATGGRSIRDETHDLSLMRVAIEQLGPMLVPVAGGALALGSALAGLGPAAILAVKGAQQAVKDGTALGQRFDGEVVLLKGGLAELERTAAGGVITGFDQAVSKVNVELPAFNASVAQSSRVLGDITSHLVGGVIGGFQTFNPLIVQAETYVDKLSARFESWATGPGGAHFARTLSTDLTALEPALANIATLVVHLLSAAQPLGLSMLSTFSTLAHLLDALPTGALTALLTGYIAFRTAVTVTSGIEAATKALRGLAAAETEATIASGAGAGAAGARGAAGGILGRQAGGIAAVTARLVPYAAAWVGAAVAFHSAERATRSWLTSTNDLKASLASGVKFASDILTFHWGAAGHDLTQGGRNASAMFSQASEQQGINALGPGIGTTPYRPGGGSWVAQQLTAANPAPGLDVSKTRSQIATLSTAATAYHGIVMVANATVATLMDRQSQLIAKYGANSAAVRANAAAIAGQEAILNAIGPAYAHTQDRVDFLTGALHNQQAAYRQINKDIEATASGYALGQRAKLTGLQNLTYAQDRSPTALIGGLNDYGKAINKAVTAETTWTKVTESNTVSIKGNQYNLSEWRQVLAASNGDKARAAGILLGHTRALAADKAALAENAAEQKNLTGLIGAAETKYRLNDQQLDQYAQALGVTGEVLARGEFTQQQWLAAVGQVVRVVSQADTALAGWVAATAQFNAGADTAASRASLMAAAMVALNGSALSYATTGAQAAQANQQFVTDFGAAKKGVVNLRTGFIDFHNAGAAPLLTDLTNLQATAAQFAAATYQNEVATRGRTQAAKDAASVYRNDTRNALISEAAQLGITRGEAQKLADRYFHWPKDARTQVIALGAEGTNKILIAIGDMLAKLSGTTWAFSLDANISPRAQAAINAVQGNRGGGAAARFAGGGVVEAYAAGGMREDHRAAIYRPRPGMVRIFAEPETKGEAYIPLANDWRRPRAQQITRETARRLGGYASFAAGGGPGGFTGVTGASSGGSGGTGGSGSQSGGSTTPAAVGQKWFYYDGLYYQGRQALNEAIAAHKATGYGITAYGTGKNRGYGYAGTGYATPQEAHNARVNALTPIAHDARAELRAWDTRGEVSRLAGRATATVQAAVKKISDTLAAARQAHAVPSALVRQFRKDNADLNAALADRDKWAARVKASKQTLAQDRQSLRDYGNQVRDTALGRFDIGTSGSGYAYGIKSSLEQAVKDQTRENDLIKKAKKLGLDPRLLQQLEQEGPQGEANLEAIVNGGKSYVQSIDADYAKLHAAATAAGTQAKGDNTELNKKIAADQKRVADNSDKQLAAQHRVHEDLKAIAGIARTISGDLTETLHRARKKA